MKIAHRDIIIQCFQKHTISKSAMQAWIAEVSHAEWKKPIDIKEIYSSADFLPGNRVVFNIKGNRFRIIVKINYAVGIVSVRFAGTHAEYDRIDAEKI